jgi:hypothetical protein
LKEDPVRKERDTAVRLRKEGRSYNEINKLLGVPKSTLSGWFRGIEISREAKEKLWNESRRRWVQNITIYNKERSKVALEKSHLEQQLASKKISHLTERELMLVGTALYWAEGARKKRWTAKFTNSDPLMIAIIMQFFRKICGVEENEFRVQLQIHPNISEEKAKLYWSEVTGIPVEQFIKTQIAISKSSKLKRPSNTLPYGTIHISVSNVNLVNRIKGWILGLSKGCMLDSRLCVPSTM